MSRPAPASAHLVNPELHHVAMVVSDLDAAIARYERLGFRNGDRIVVPDQSVDMAMFRSGGGWIELIRPIDPDGPIARYLAKRGEGMHHIAYAVPDLVTTLHDLAAAGVRLIDTSPRTGAHGWRIAFIHPESCAGVLTELVQE